MIFAVLFPCHFLLGIILFTRDTCIYFVKFFKVLTCLEKIFLFPSSSNSSTCAHMVGVSVLFLSRLFPLSLYIRFLTFWSFSSFSVELFYFLHLYLQREFIMRLFAWPVFLLDDCCWNFITFSWRNTYLWTNSSITWSLFSWAIDCVP